MTEPVLHALILAQGQTERARTTSGEIPLAEHMITDDDTTESLLDWLAPYVKEENLARIAPEIDETTSGKTPI